MTRAIGLLAAVALAVLDYLILAAAFLYRPAAFPFVAIALLAAVAASGWLRRPWLVHTAQGVVSVLALVAMAELGPDLRASDVAQVVGLVAVGHALAWLLARAIPARTPGREPR
jgi:4-amino-4-deoxy-L-arabinose transferase-like glycosyltransferase